MPDFQQDAATCECLCDWLEKNIKLVIVLGAGALLLYFAKSDCYQCDECERMYKYLGSLQRHQQFKHGSPSYD